MTAASAAPSVVPQAPSLVRRLAGFLYEGVLLFGIVWLAGMVYGVVTNQRHALQGAVGLQATLFIVLGAYFVYFWSRHGQTLAMRTWRLRLQGPDGKPPGPLRAAFRYALAWLWFLPALSIVSFSGLTGGGAVTVVVIAGVLAYAALARLRADRQFLHDVACGTRLVDVSRFTGSGP
ncbi:MAG: RDD family protein [Rubrivivax sp.]|nr:RDD family protein [Rubrivivax sp.]